MASYLSIRVFAVDVSTEYLGQFSMRHGQTFEAARALAAFGYFVAYA